MINTVLNNGTVGASIEFTEGGTLLSLSFHVKLTYFYSSERLITLEQARKVTLLTTPEGPGEFRISLDSVTVMLALISVSITSLKMAQKRNGRK